MNKVFKVFADELQNRCHAVCIRFLVEIKCPAEKMRAAVGKEEAEIGGGIAGNVIGKTGSTSVSILKGALDNVFGLDRMLECETSAVGKQRIVLNQVAEAVIGNMQGRIERFESQIEPTRLSCIGRIAFHAGISGNAEAIGAP